MFTRVARSGDRLHAWPSRYARWTIEVTPWARTTSSTATTDCTSPCTTCSRSPWVLSGAMRRSAIAKSNTTTRSPWARSFSARHAPIRPVPPVINVAIVSSRSCLGQEQSPPAGGVMRPRSVPDDAENGGVVYTPGKRHRGRTMTRSRATDEVSLALLGAGFVADFYMQALAYVPHQRVVAVYSRTQERAQAFAKKWNIPRATDRLDDLIQLDGVDLYVVGLPTFRHQDVCLRLAEAGRSLLCTKPLGRTAAEARTMLEAVRARGVRHGYLETEVFTPALVRAKELVDRGAIGEVVMVKSREAHFGSHSPYTCEPELAGGGPLLLLGSHNVEFSRFMLDKPRAVEVFAWTGTLVHQTPLEDTAVMLIRFDGGKMAQIEVNWITRHGLDLRNEITGREGTIYTDITGATGIRAFALRDAGYVLEKAPATTGWIQPVAEEPFTYGYVGHLKHFVDALRAGAPFAETFEDGYVVNAIIDAGYRSARSGRWEPVESS